MSWKPEITKEIELFALDLEKRTEDTKYLSMPTKLFFHFEKLPFDIYLNLDFRHIKYIHADDEIDHSRIKHLLDQGIMELFFESIHRQEFSSHLLGRLKDQLNEPTNSFVTKTTNSSSVHRTLSEIVTTLGFRPKIQTICQMALDSLTKEIEAIGHHDLNRYLKVLKTRDFDVSYKHIQLTSFCCVNMVEKLEWPKAQELSRKLVYASYLSDFSLQRPEYLAMRKEYDVCDLNTEERQLVEEHPLRSSKLLNSVPFICSDTMKIILQHHGSPTGVGLKNYQHPSLTQLTLVFIAAQEFASRILFGDSENYRQHIKDLMEEHSDSFIKDYLEVLESSFETA